MGSNFEQSNKADWVTDISATDAETGDAIDFTGASAAFMVRDQSNCLLLSGTIDDGTITQPSSTVLEVTFTAEQMSALCPGEYKVGAVYEIDDQTIQLLVGTVSIYDGVAEL